MAAWMGVPAGYCINLAVARLLRAGSDRG